MGREADANAAARQLARIEAEKNLPKLIDRFGKDCPIGTQVEWHSELPMVLTVVDLKPNMDPRAPAGAMFAVLSGQVVLPAFAKHRLTKITYVIAAPTEAEIDAAREAARVAAEANQRNDSESAGGAQGSQGGIILTDMDKTARQTLAEVLPPHPIEPVAPPAAPVVDAPPPALSLVPPVAVDRSEPLPPAAEPQAEPAAAPAPIEGEEG